jgi:hypothetical protein
MPLPNARTDTEPAGEASRAAAGAGYAREWGLFCDYTAATGQPTLPTTVAAMTGFLTQVPARGSTVGRRVAAIAAAHRAAGHLLDRPYDETATTARPRPNAAAMIAACPTRGWPHGFAGRRDAFLVVLTAVLGHTHTQARLLQADDVTASEEIFTSEGITTRCPADNAATRAGYGQWRIRGRPVPADDDPRTCPVCAVVRWLEILGTADGLGRGSARMHLSAAQAPTATTPHTHVVAEPPRWRYSAHLVPAIDRHGWIDDYRPLGPRSISTRLTQITSRTRATGPIPDAAPPPESASPNGGRGTATLDDVLALLDQVADDADAVNARIQALLTDAPPSRQPARPPRKGISDERGDLSAGCGGSKGGATRGCCTEDVAFCELSNTQAAVNFVNAPPAQVAGEVSTTARNDGTVGMFYFL